MILLLRRVAKTVVAAGLAERCEVQAAYAIGVAEPVSLALDTFGTGEVEDWVLAEAVSRVFDLRPAAIIRDLGLREPIFERATLAHFGNDWAPWEVDLPVHALRDAVSEHRVEVA